MSFKNDIPNYKSYSEEKYHMKGAVPAGLQAGIV